jgi:transglutaminase-like putative cysteine protease
VLAPYRNLAVRKSEDTLDEWLAKIWRQDDKVQTYTFLQRMNAQIRNGLSYRPGDEPGVQTAAETLSCGTGCCRDFANLFVAAARRLGLAARFASGYYHAPPSTIDFGATHAGAEVYLPGAGWKEFDPTLGEIAGTNHIAVAMAAARLPESVPPLAGSFFGLAAASLDVGVGENELS